MSTVTNISAQILRNSSYQTALTAAASSVTAETPTRADYNFVGWFTAQTGGDEINLTDLATETRTVYARWSASSYIITYNANGGTGSMTSQTVTAGGSVTLRPNAFTRDHYTFQGWAVSSGGGVAYADEATINNVNANITLYAVWQALPSYTVSYNANGGTGSIPSQTVYSDDPTVTLSNGTGFSRTGYTLTNWNTAANGSGTSYSLSQTISVSANIPLYAIWTENTYTVTYEPNGGTGGPYVDTITYTQAQSYTILSYAACGITKPTDMNFVEWNTNALGNGTTYLAGNNYTITGNLTIWAIWETV